MLSPSPFPHSNTDIQLSSTYFPGEKRIVTALWACGRRLIFPRKQLLYNACSEPVSQPSNKDVGAQKATIEMVELC